MTVIKTIKEIHQIKKRHQKIQLNMTNLPNQSKKMLKQI